MLIKLCKSTHYEISIGMVMELKQPTPPLSESVGVGVGFMRKQILDILLIGVCDFVFFNKYSDS